MKQKLARPALDLGHPDQLTTIDGSTIGWCHRRTTAEQAKQKRIGEFINPSRRRFITRSLVAGGALALPWSEPAWAKMMAAKSSGRFPIWQGMTNSNSAQISVLVDESLPVSFRIKNLQGGEVAFRILRRELSYSKLQSVVKIKVDGLSLLQSYSLEVIETSTGNVLDRRQFLALDLNSNHVQLALVSCANDKLMNVQENMWAALEQQEADIIFFVGDSVYADNKTDSRSDHSGGWENYWQRYQDTFSRLGLYRMEHLVPILATWDDHDFGVNNGDGSFQEKNITTFLFDLFWGNQPVAGYQKGPGISSLLTMAGQRFFLMDNRSERSPIEASYGYHWGEDVQNFLFDGLSKSADPAWIVTGTQVFGGYRKMNSFEYDQQKNLQDVLTRLQKISAPVMFATGDIHFSEIMNLEPELMGYGSFELTSSSVHSYTFPGQHYKAWNPRRVASAATSAHNFLMVDAKPQNGALAFDVRSVTKNTNAKFTFQGLLKRG